MPTSHSSFHRELLPAPRPFYEGELGELRRSSRNWYRPKGGCPFHPSKSKTSFSVNIETGGFHCFACGASGGDLVDFVRLRDGCGFKTACQSLGCWDDTAPVRKLQGRKVPYLVMDYVIDGVAYRAEVPDVPRTESALHHRLYHDAAERLKEIHEGGPEKFEGEEDTQWGIMASALELIQMEAADVR